jgi:hypothetical protein
LSGIQRPLLWSQGDTFHQELRRDLLPDLPAPARGLSGRLPTAERYGDFKVGFVHRRNMADSGHTSHPLFLPRPAAAAGSHTLALTGRHQRLSQQRLLSAGDRPSGLAKIRFRAHVHEMEKYRSRMLEVSVKSDRPPRWEWQVTSNGEMIANGFEGGQIEARFEGYNAMFLLLAAGWVP